MGNSVKDVNIETELLEDLTDKEGRRIFQTIISDAKCHKVDFLLWFSSASSKGSLKLLMQLQRNQVHHSTTLQLSLLLHLIFIK